MTFSIGLPKQVLLVFIVFYVTLEHYVTLLFHLGYLGALLDLKIAQKGHFVAISGLSGSKLVKHSVSRRNKSWHIRSDAINSHFTKAKQDQAISSHLHGKRAG